MKQSKKLLSVLLALLLTVLTVSCLGACFTASAVSTIQFGSYPQTKVNETSALKTAANAAKWKSYRYYSGTGDAVDGKMQPGDWMQFADFFVDGVKYRAVKFTKYRPYCTGLAARSDSTVDTDQSKNGYKINIVYYFRYEPLVWRVLKENTKMVMCDSIIDAQAYQNVVYQAANGNFYQGINSSVYSNNYEKSSIRTWLNTDFYNTAFTEAQKARIKAVTVSNTALNTTYSAKETVDWLFLMNWNSVNAESYGFDSDKARAATGTNYAKCQGLWVDTGNAGASSWTLRTAANNSRFVCVVSSAGTRHYEGDSYSCFLGIRPACMLTDLTSDNTVSNYLYSAGTTYTPPAQPETQPQTETQTQPEGGTQPTGKVCKYCGEVHEGFFQKIVGFFHSILALLGLHK